MDDAAKIPVMVRSFTMGKWGRRFREFVEFLQPGDDVIYAKACGTPACAMGHYAVRTDLQRSFAIDADGDLVVRKKGYSAYYNTGDNTMVENHQISHHFDITDDDREDLFGSKGCDGAKTPGEASAFIKHFVRVRS